MFTEPKILQGGIFVDDRGSIHYVNDFDFTDVSRFYQVRNHRVGCIRAWHGHVKEAKYVFVPQGVVLVKLVAFKEMDKWKKCDIDSCNTKIYTFVLSSENPTILSIPAGFYNGFKTLTDNTIVQFFSTSILEESKDDDYREEWDIFGADTWKENYR